MCNRIVQACMVFGLLLLGTLSAPVLAQEAKVKSLAVKPRTGEFAGTEFYANSHALIIGINQYVHLPKDKQFDFAEKDATDLRDVLVSSYGFLPENTVVLLGKEATKKGIENALAALADSNRVKPDDRVLVFFSGHGQTVKVQNGKAGFLVPQDAEVNLDQPDNAGPYLLSCLSMDSIWGGLEDCPARHRLLIVDACFGGLFAKPKGLNAAPHPSTPLMKTYLARPALQVLTAGSEDEEAVEDPKLGHSIFTFHLLEELKAQAANVDSVFTAEELATKIKRSVGKHTEKSKFPQTPQFASRGTEGEVVFVTTITIKTTITVRTQKLPATPHTPGRASADIRSIEKLKQNGGNSSARTSINPSDGAEMVFIPAGRFLMGDDDLGDNPRHTVTLSGYYMYKNLVTVGQYKQFCNTTNRQMPAAPYFDTNWSQEDHPIVNVTWEDAAAYAQWAGAELPTEAQWEKAARGTDGRKYPWGDNFDTSKIWCSKIKNGDARGTAAVGYYSVSPYGCTDMGGNVWQWCRDQRSDNFWLGRLSERVDPENQSLGGRSTRVLRGSSWYYNMPEIFRAAFRFGFGPYDGRGNHHNVLNDVGFRCVVRAASN